MIANSEIQRAAAAALTRWKQQAGGAERRQLAQGHVVGDIERQREPLFLPVLAQKPHALHPSFVRPRHPGIHADADASASNRLETEQRPQ